MILGPTGTGKSAAAVEIAERLAGEIVGCDALQVYRGFDVATAKPSQADRLRVPHHLVDCADPRHDFSVASYVRLAEAAIQGALGRGRAPLVVGGTGMYLRGLLRGIVPAPARNPVLRERLERLRSRYGAARLHRWLFHLDPESGRRLPPGDSQRVVRALELALLAGKTWGETLRSEGTWAGGVERYATLKVGLDLERELLGRRLDERVDRYFEAGLPAEVQGLLERGVPATANAFKAIGYREVLQAILSGVDPESVREQVKASTRQLAKRQRTWFRKEPNVIWLDAAEGPSAIAERIERLWLERT